MQFTYVRTSFASNEHANMRTRISHVRDACGHRFRLNNTAKEVDSHDAIVDFLLTTFLTSATSFIFPRPLSGIQRIFKAYSGYKQCLFFLVIITR